MSLEEALGLDRAREIRRILHVSMGETLLHDLEAGKLNDPDYVSGVNVTAHNNRVGEVAYALASKLGLNDGQCARVLIAGKLHDDGKKKQKIHLLRRQLTPEERSKIHDHQLESCLFIESQIQQLRHPENIRLMRDVYEIVLRHHFPEEMEDLIVHFADKYVAMTEPRDRPAIMPRDALRWILVDMRKLKYERFGEMRAQIAWALHSIMPSIRQQSF
ncbi:MAG: hypothetical protein NVSMB66_5450 [Candidatus Doudnabacteria bacterium]